MRLAAGRSELSREKPEYMRRQPIEIPEKSARSRMKPIDTHSKIL